MRPLAADDPRTIGEYRLQARLGQGGMGRVYLGLSPGGRAVAVKVLHPQLAGDTEFLRRFQREVVSARAVSGIYTAPVVATGLDEHPPWLATAFVPGPSLHEMVGEHGPLPEAALWPLAGGLVEALQAIHACGVVHRDLKPANVMLAADGPRLIDFGISRAADGTALTAAGVVFGTPGYMAPEQAEGKLVGPPSDVFALGCVLAYAATGTGPFGEGSAATVLYRVVHAEATLDGVPGRLRELVARCLAKDPAARPSPRELAASIAREAHGTGSSAVSFWPRPVADVIGGYQASLEGARTGPSTQRSSQLTATARVGSQVAGQRDYPDPQGYGAAQQPYAPPRGYPAAPAGAAGYQPPYPAAGPPRRVARPPLPGSVLGAVRMMYAGAAHALILYGLAILTVNSIINATNAALSRANPNYVPIIADRARNGIVTGLAVVCLIQVALWLWMAWGSRNGRNWARVTGTVFFGIYTIANFAVLTRPGDGTGLTKLLAIVGWLIACTAVVLLWQPRSTGFFKPR